MGAIAGPMGAAISGLGKGAVGGAKGGRQFTSLMQSPGAQRQLQQAQTGPAAPLLRKRGINLPQLFGGDQGLGGEEGMASPHVFRTPRGFRGSR